MPSVVQDLLDIQEIDVETAKCRGQLGRYEGSRKSRRAEVERIRVQVAETGSHILQLEKQVREADREVLGWRESLDKFSGQQARVKTQKEYDALTHEMAETERKISDADERGMGFLEEEERLTTRLGQLERDLAKKSEECEQELARIDEREAATLALVEGWAERRRAVVARLDPTHLHRYEQLCERIPGTAIVPVVDGNCGGCFMRVILHRIQVAGRDAEAPVECTSCHRFLYLPDPSEETQ